MLEDKQETGNPSVIDKPAETEKTLNKVLIQKSPPIFVNGVGNIRLLKILSDTIAKDNYSLKVLDNEDVKIQPHSSEKYLPIVEELKKKNTEFFTYQRKQDKTYKVVLRNMHPSVDINELKNEIESFDHQVIRITNIMQRISQKPLPLFFIELASKDNNKKYMR